MNEFLRKRVRLYPNKEQQNLFWRYSGMMRFVYNKAKAILDSCYKDTGETISEKDIRARIRQKRDNEEGFSWLGEISLSHYKESGEQLLPGKKELLSGEVESACVQIKTQNQALLLPALRQRQI